MIPFEVTKSSRLSQFLAELRIVLLALLVLDDQLFLLPGYFGLAGVLGDIGQRHRRAGVGQSLLIIADGSFDALILLHTPPHASVIQLRFLGQHPLGHLLVHFGDDLLAPT